MRWILLTLYLAACSIFMEWAWGVSSTLFWMFMLVTCVFLIIYCLALWLGKEVGKVIDNIKEG